MAPAASAMRDRSRRRTDVSRRALAATLWAVPLSVLIVDDHDGFRSRAKRALELDGFDVIAEAADIAHGVAACRKHQPDVVLLDVHLPDGCGMDCAAQFAEAAPSARVVLISTYDEIDMASAAQQDGVVGFLPKAELSGHELLARLDAYGARQA